MGVSSTLGMGSTMGMGPTMCMGSTTMGMGSTMESTKDKGRTMGIVLNCNMKS